MGIPRESHSHGESHSHAHLYSELQRYYRQIDRQKADWTEHLTTVDILSNIEYWVVMRNFLTKPWDCMREAVLTVSPNKQYWGIFLPTTPATTLPVWIPVPHDKNCVPTITRVGCRQTKLFNINVLQLGFNVCFMYMYFSILVFLVCWFSCDNDDVWLSLWRNKDIY